MQTESTLQRDPESIILEALASSPVPPGDLKSRLKLQIPKLNDKQFKAVLNALVAARRIHGKPILGAKGQPTTKMESYVLGAPPPPRERAPQEILRALATGPLSLAKLKQRTKGSLKGISETDYSAVVTELVASRQLYARFKRGKNGVFTKVVESYGISDSLARDLVQPILALCETTRAEAALLGMDEASFIASLLDGLGKVGVQVPPPREEEPTADREQVLRGIRELVAREGHGALIPIRKLRGAIALESRRLDAALLQLFADDAIILHHHDYVGSLTQAERDALLVDQYGNYYVGVALRGEG